MTPEQIANRIKEEYRKHNRLGVDTWCLIAATKIYAQILIDIENGLNDSLNNNYTKKEVRE